MQNSLETLERSKTARIWQRPTGVLAAVLFLTLLVGGLLLALSIGQAGQAPSAASNVISSVVLSDKANSDDQSSSLQNFAAGQTIWLNGTINVGKISGSNVLQVKWYENGQLLATNTKDFQIPQSPAVAAALKDITLRMHQVYSQPGDGQVQVYWNGQLVVTKNFIIQ